MNKKTQNTCGFTLVEAVITIIILGLLAGIAVPRIIASRTETNKAVIKKILLDTRSAIQQAKYLHDPNAPAPWFFTGSAYDMVTTIHPGGYMGRNPLNGLNSVCFLDLNGAPPIPGCDFEDTGPCAASNCKDGSFPGHPDTGASDFGWIYEPDTPPYIWAYQDGYRDL